MKIYFPFRWIGVPRATVAFHCQRKICAMLNVCGISTIYLFIGHFYCQTKKFSSYCWKWKHVFVNLLLANNAFSCIYFYLFKCNWIPTRHNNRLAKYHRFEFLHKINALFAIWLNGFIDRKNKYTFSDISLSLRHWIIIYIIVKILCFICLRQKKTDKLLSPTIIIKCTLF